MTIYFANIAGGSLFGALLSWILMLWVKVFVTQVYTAAPKDYSDNSLHSKKINFPDWIIITVLTITSGTLAFWRQWSPEFFNDIILVKALVGVALIDRKTMLIEGRLIALAISCEPDLIIADEPTTALDVSIQYQILQLLKDLTKKRNLGVIIITHDS